MTNREQTIFNGHVMYAFSTLTSKLEQLEQIQVLLNKEELEEQIGKSREDFLSGLKVEGNESGGN